RQLKWDFQKHSDTGLGKTLDFKEMETAIDKSENEMKVTVYFFYCNKTQKHRSTSLAEEPENECKLTFTIKQGHINPSDKDLIVFKRSSGLCWSSVEQALRPLCQLLQAYAVPMAVVKAEQLVKLAQRWNGEWEGAPPVSSLISVLYNQGKVLDVLSRPGQRFKGEGGAKAAAVHIQSCWRRYTARSAYLRYCRCKWAVGTISLSWLMHTQLCRVKKALQARRFSHLENQRCRAQHLAANWNYIQGSKRTIIHIPSLGRSHPASALPPCLSWPSALIYENVEVIYVCPMHLKEDMKQYYSSLLKSNRPQEESLAETLDTSLSKTQFIMLTPEAVDYFPNHSMCLSSLLKYSPHTLQRIRRLVQGKHSYIVPGVAHVDDLAVADELGVPLMGPEPAVSQLYGTKSGARKIFRAAGVEMPPGAEDLYSLEQLHERLAELMVQHLDVTLWLFKMDSELGGSALCDVSHMKSYAWALNLYQRYGPDTWRMVAQFLKEIPEWLSSHAHPANTSEHWAGFLQTFLRQGGVVEARPPSHSPSCVTVDLLLEPGGHISMLSCGDLLQSPCGLKVLGSSVPQTSLCSDTLQWIYTLVGQACLEKGIVGHVSVDMVSFIHHTSKQHKVWALDLHLSYSDHLAMTQMLLYSTQGTLSCQNSFEVPMSNTEQETEESAEKKKQGTLFALYDSSERRQIGMIVVSDSPQRALLTFAHNLSVIHQEISSSRTQGGTNFKVRVNVLMIPSAFYGRLSEEEQTTLHFECMHRRCPPF
uniref:IQCH-like ATP-grasp domain-containing protein n=1 Tax=Periophthalmus magnuspinnatus TaxID=409849 RepID=A0A3B4A4K5_9GOBI